MLFRSAYGNAPLPPPLAHSAVCTLTIKFLSMQEVRRPDPDLPGGGRLHESGGGRGVLPTRGGRSACCRETRRTYTGPYRQVNMLVALVFNFIVFPLFFFQSDHFNNWMFAGAALTKKAMPNTKEFTPALRASFKTVEMIFITVQYSSFFRWSGPC